MLGAVVARWASRRAAWIGILLGASAGCATVDSGHEARESGCKKGEVAGYSGVCMPVGIPLQACAPMFVDEDGFCHPRMDKCPKGTIPKFDEGCVPVGIPKCAALFLGDDGLCRPSMAKCMSQPGTFPVPAEGCVPIDGPNGCGSGRWGELPDEPGNIYVDPTAAAGGDGSMGKPVRTIAEAMTLVADGGRIALAAGTYEEPAVIEKSMEIAGVCPSKVKIHGVATGWNFPVIVGVPIASKVSLRNLSIGGAGMGLVAQAGSQVAMSRVHVDGATMMGVAATDRGTTVTIDHSVIESTLPAPQGFQDFGWGIAVQTGAHVQLMASAVLKNTETGLIVATPGSEIEADACLVEGTLEKSSQVGDGAYVTGGGKLTLKGSAVVGNHVVGVIGAGAGSQLFLSENLIGATLPEMVTGSDGTGVGVQLGAQATLEGNAIVDSHWEGIQIVNAGTRVTSKGDLVINSCPELSDGESGVGIAVHAGAQLTLDGSALVANHTDGLHLEGTGSSATVTSALVEGTQSHTKDKLFGYGIEAIGGSRATVSGSAIVANRTGGITAAEAGSQLAVSATLVERTLPDESADLFGRGIEVDAAAKLSVDGVLITGNQDAGLVVYDTKDAAVTRSLIEDTTGRHLDGQNGFGLVCAQCTLTLADTILRGCAVGGVLIADSASAVVSRVLVDGVRVGRSTLFKSDQVIDGVGDGIIVHDQSTASLTDVRVTGAARAGVLFASSGGSVSKTSTAGGQFGLVLEGAPVPALGRENSFAGTRRAKLENGDLAVPSAPPKFP